MRPKEDYELFGEELCELCIKHKMAIVGAYQSDTEHVTTCDLGAYGYPWIKEV